MSRSRRIAVYAAVWLVGAHPALALNDTIGVTVGSGKTANLISFAGGNVISEAGICDATTANQCAAVSAGGALSVAGAVTNAGTFAVQLSGATNNINNIAGTVSLPTGAATSALQTTGNTALTTINTTLGTPMQATGGSVTANAGTNLNTSTLATSANQPTNAAQGSTTSGQTGPLTQCAATTAAPTYTTAQTNPLSCDTAGNVRVNVVTATGLTQGSTTSGQTGSMIMAAVTTAAPTYTTAQTDYLSMDLHGGLRIGGAGYPAGATPITASATGTTGATTATLATGASVTTYLCSMSIRANATAAATGNATVTGTITGTLNFTQWTAPLASGLGVTEMIFSPCVPASGVNTGIAVVSAAPGTGGVVSVTATGFTL